MSLGVYTILTEFKFDIASAMLGSQALQSQLEGLSGAAEQASNSLMKVGVGVLGSMGLGTTGVLGSLGTMMMSFEKFKQSQRSIAQISQTNFGGTWAENMERAAESFERMSDAANEFGLDSSTMLNTAKAVYANLASDHLDTPDLAKSTDLARFYLKSSSVMGVDPSMNFNNMVQLAMGRGQMNDQWTQRLFADSKDLKQFKGSAMGFNALEASKRIELLTTAMKNLGGNANAVAENAASLSGQLNKLKNLVMGPFTVFREFGQYINELATNVLTQVNGYLQTYGPRISHHVAALFKSMAKSPEEAYIVVKELMGLKHDVHSTARVFEMSALIQGVGHLAKWAGFISKPFGPWVTIFTGVLTMLIDAFSRMPFVITKIIKVWAGLIAAIALIFAFPVVAQMMLIGGAIQWFFGMLTKASAMGDIKDIKNVPEQVLFATQNLEALKITLSKFTQPFILLQTYLAEHLSFLFQMSYWYDWINDKAFEMVVVITKLQEFFMAIMMLPQAIESTIKYFTSSAFLKNPMGIVEASNAPFKMMSQKLWEENLAPYYDQKTKNPVSSTTMHVDNVTINNQFKEQMEPDRIAFTLKDQLLKSVAAKTGGGRSMAFAGVGG